MPGQTQHSIKPSMQTLELITPKVATEMLKTKINNRPLSNSKVIEYALAIDEGRWSVNGETLKFDLNNHLFDGQHRLEACVLADKPFRTYVVRGIEDPKAFATVDVGKNRTHADMLGVAGFVATHNTAAAAALIYLFKHRMLTLKGPRTGTGRVDPQKRFHIDTKIQSARSSGSAIPKEVLVDFSLGIKDGLHESVLFGSSSPAKKFLTVSVIAGCHYLFRERDAVEAKRFFDDIGEGAGLDKNDAVFRLRERLISNQSSTSKLTKWAILLLIFKAWQKRRDGERTHYLKIQDNEEFPKKLK